VHVPIFSDSFQNFKAAVSIFDPPIQAYELFFYVSFNLVLIQSNKFPLLFLKDHIDYYLVKLKLKILAIIATKKFIQLCDNRFLGLLGRIEIAIRNLCEGGDILPMFLQNFYQCKFNFVLNKNFLL
jgi:hypothetical protein